MSIPRILCISLSTIERDARVLRQIGVLAEAGEVTTIGYGNAPVGSTHHIQVPDGLTSLPQTMSGVLKLAVRAHRRVELKAPAVAFAVRALRGQTFDLVVSNDARVLALAHHVARGAPVWADMHEWAPEERTHVLSWRLLVAPFMTALCRRYLPLSASVTTVAESIARLYQSNFGVAAQVMRNSSPWLDLTPSALDGDAIRLVHSGGAVHGRSLETMIEAVKRLDDRFTLDLYLVPANDGGRYLAQLKALAQGTSRIRFHDPVPPAALPTTLNQYDVGVFWIPPTHTNARLTLPNKFFDYVQARLAVAVGPTIEMATLVDRFDLGIVSDGFSVADCIRSLMTLTPESIAAAKAASDLASPQLSFEVDAAIARNIVERLVDGRTGTIA